MVNIRLNQNINLGNVVFNGLKGGVIFMDTLIWIKLISLVIAIWFSIVIVAKIIYKQNVTQLTFMIHAVSLVAFLTIQFRLYQ